MGLTIGSGPLSPRPRQQTNYRLDSPDRLLYLDDFPRRVRATFAGATLIDTRDGKFLHETGLLPVLYVPDSDVDDSLIEQSPHTTHCPFKGDARYWSVRCHGRVAADAVWAYPSPNEGAGWLQGHKAADWEAMDVWYDEDEEVHGHLRDPYHRVDARSTSRRVRVVAGDKLLAESTQAKVLSETGLPNRYYLPRVDVRADIQPSATTAVCPYKGTSTYWSTPTLTDVAWSYEQPLEEALKVTGHLCFDEDQVSVTLD